VLGVLVGFGAALLLAPRSGAQTRRGFLDAAQGIRGAVGARRERARDAVGAGREAARDARAELARRVAEAKALRRAGRAPGAVDAPAPPAARLVVVSVDTETDVGDLAR
jgi:hypothetical protein